MQDKCDYPIVYFISGLGTGGAEAMLVKVLRHSGSSRNNVVVSLTKGGKNRDILIDSGVKVIELDMKSVLTLPLRLFRLIRFLRQKRTFIIHAWMYHASLLATLIGALFLKNVSIIWNIRHSVHSLSDEKYVLRVIISVLGMFSSNPKWILFNSNVSLKQHKEIWGAEAKKLRVMPNGFDTETWKPHSSGLSDVIDRRKSVVHVGRAHPMKNQAGLVTAFQRIMDEFPNVDLYLVGKGTEKFVESVNARSRIVSLGEVTDLYSKLSSFDYFVLCSDWGEGFPNVLGEAMACGLPCLTTNVGDSAIVISDSRWVIPPKNPEMLLAGLRKLISLSPEEYRKIAAQNREVIISNYDISAICNQYDRLHDDVLICRYKK